MKKIVSILVLVFAFTLTTQAQKKRKHKKANFSTEQKVDLAVKQMTLRLDLTASQQRQIKPLIAAKIADRKAAMEKRKAMKEAKKKPTVDELYAIKSNLLDKQIAMKSKIKNILNKEQFEKFEKMQKRRKMMAMKKMKSKRDAMKKKNNKRKIKNRNKIEEGK